MKIIKLITCVKTSLVDLKSYKQLNSNKKSLSFEITLL